MAGSVEPYTRGGASRPPSGRYVERLRRLADYAPEGQRHTVAEPRAGPYRHHRRQTAAIECQPRVADRVDPAIPAVQTACPQSSLHGPPLEPEHPELARGDQAVLPSRESGQPLLTIVWATLCMLRMLNVAHASSMGWPGARSNVSE